MSFININQTSFDHTFQSNVTFLSNSFFQSNATIASDAKLEVNGTSTFNGAAIFKSTLTAESLQLSSSATLNDITVNGITISGKLYDGDDGFGTAGQLLSSDGTDLKWIDASSTSVANANNVGTNVDSTNADQFITFVGASSGNNPIRVNGGLKYNPSTNTLNELNLGGSSTAVNLNVTGNLTVGGQLKDGAGNFGSSGQVLSSDGTDTAWINAGSLSAGAAAEVGVTAVNDDSSHFLTFVDSSSGNENIKVDTNLTYNPSTNTLTVTNISGNGSGLSGIESFITGMIILWFGNTGNIPNGFVLCDGNNNAPDLRDKFIIGAGNNYSVNATGGSANSTLVSHSHTVDNHTHGDGSLSVDNHTHNDGSLSVSNHTHGSGSLSVSNHTHGSGSLGTNNSGNHSHSYSRLNSTSSYNRGVPIGSGGSAGSSFGTQNTNNGGSHSHNVNGSTGGSSPGVSGSTGGSSPGLSGSTGGSSPGVSGSTGGSSPGTNAQGSSATNTNLPPYYALCYIMKT